MTQQPQQKRYCIGCKHFRYESASEGYYYSSQTFASDEPAETACRLGYWHAKFNGAFSQEKFEAAMASAQTCDDFTERETPV